MYVALFAGAAGIVGERFSGGTPSCQVKTNSIETAPFKLVFQLKRAVLIWPDRSRIYLQQTDIQLVQEVFPGQKPEHSRFLFPYRILLI